MSFVSWTICGAIYENSDLTNAASGYAQLVFIWLFGIFYDIGFSGLLIAYALEVLPFKLRAKGMMIMNITVQAILALSNQTNKIAWNRMPKHWNFMLFYTVSLSPPLQPQWPCCLFFLLVLVFRSNANLYSWCSCGISVNWPSFTSSMSKQKDLRWRRSHGYSTAQMLLPISIFGRLRRRCTKWRGNRVLIQQPCHQGVREPSKPIFIFYSSSRWMVSMDGILMIWYDGSWVAYLFYP